MNEFNDKEYAILIGNLLHDTKCADISNMGKMAGIRKHAEVMVRKILNLGNSVYLTLGQVKLKSSNKDVRKGLEDLGSDLSAKLVDAVRIINPLGRDGTHTQHTDNFSDEEVERVEDALLDMYALIFIRFFLKNHISIYTSPVILHEFSILPPTIRYKTWSYLYEIDKFNIQIANKLCLSIIKTYSKEIALKWLNENEENLRAIPYPNDDERKRYMRLGGYEIKPGLYQVSIDFDKFNNIYDLLYAKIMDKRTSVNESGKMYKTFEDAINHYTNYKSMNIPSVSDELAEFHSLMEFVYLGRKSKD